VSIATFRNLACDGLGALSGGASGVTPDHRPKVKADVDRRQLVCMHGEAIVCEAIGRASRNTPITSGG
jgi:hypothetical protein